MESDLPGSVIGDPVRLGQVIINLVSNAIKFTASGKIELLARLEKEDPEHSTVCFTVSDTGIGIDLDKQSLIFAPFRQTDGSITRRYGGTGLGLTISRFLVEMMGGLIWLESIPGEGSRFHFTIEFAKPAPVMALAPAVGKDCKLRAIIIEPEEARRALLSAMLQAWNIDAAVVDSGPTALDVIRWIMRLDRPRLCLGSLSVALEYDGFLLASLQQGQEQARLPLIVIGDHASLAPKSPDLEVAGRLDWPVSQSALLESVFRFLRPSTIGTDTPQSPQEGQRLPGDRNGFVSRHEDILANQELNPRSIRKAQRFGDVCQQRPRGDRGIPVHAVRPGLDGYPNAGNERPEATAAIRAMEAATGKHTPSSP